MPCSTNFRDKLLLVNSMKSLIFDLTKILLPKRLVLTYSLTAKVMHYQIFFYRIEIELLVFKAMFTLYRIDFRSGSRIDPIQCEQCLGKSNRTGPVWS